MFSDEALLNPGILVNEPVVISARIEARDTSNVLVIVAKLGSGWHLYSLEQKPGGPRPTKITIADESAYLPEAPFVATPPPEKKTIDGVPGWEGLIVEEHAGTVTWTAPLEKNPQSKKDAVVGNISLQLCKDNACTPPQTIPFSALLTETNEETTTPVIQHLPERGHVAIEGSVGLPTQSDNGCLAWPIRIELLPQPGWHLYAPKTDPTTAIGQGKPSIISLAPSGAVRVCEILANEPQLLDDPELRAAGAVEGSIQFTLQVEQQDSGLSNDSDQTRQLEAIIGYQTCSDVTCDPPWASRLSITLPEGNDDSPKIVFSDSRYGEAAQHPATLTFPSQEKLQLSSATRPAEPVPAQSLSLPVALLAGLLGGLILNLMPCVLPVLGLKLMSFAQQSGRARQEIFQLNLWYCAGLYAVFFVLATASVAANLGLAGNNLAWGEQFTSSSFNITMAAIVFSFALSFLGVWELPIPGFIGSTAGKVQTQEGPAGSFFKGVLSTVLATPCSGPFLGPVFGFTLTQPTGVTYAVFAAIATGMALPYFIVGIFPSLIRFVPKPGPWMETLKEVLGFVMLGTVVFLFTFLDSNYFVPTFALLISIWIGCWWVGRYQKTKGMAGLIQWLQAAAVSVTLGTLVFSFLGPSDSVIDWKPFSKERLAELRSNGSTVMVDFSAEWCLTCKYNLAFAIETSRVKTALEKSKIVPMLADWTDGSPEIKAMLESLSSKSIPVLAFFPPNTKGMEGSSPIILRDLVTESQVLDAIEKVELVRAPVPDIRPRNDE
ncbi:thioredoxin family protein [Pirellulales bacterium]|nr:thioredoxin family protein [Pirellulales bacterium]